MRGEWFWGVLLGAVAVNGFAEGEIFTYRVGRFEVYMLVENRRQGTIGSLLVGADPAQSARYLPGGTYTAETNTFIIRSPERILVVDTGFGGAIFEGMKKLGIDPAAVDGVLLTHLHGDHIGGLQREGKPLFPRARVYLSRQEEEYWLRANPNPGAAAALGAYGSRVETFSPGELGSKLTELFPGISPAAAFGHTPGHTLYLAESGGERLLLWGDLMHVQDIQFPLPQTAVSYDTDPRAAAESRRKALDYVSAHTIPVGGMHLVYPAVGRVLKEGAGYRFVPAAEAPAR